MSESIKLKIDRKTFRRKLRNFYAENDYILREIMTRMKENKMSIGTLIERNAREFSDIIAVKFEDEKLTYKEFNECVNRYAHYFISIGLKKKDVAVVLMKNRLELLFILSALAKIGVISSLINSDFQGEALIHSLTISPSKIIIIDETCYEAFEAVKPSMGLTKEQILLFVRDQGKVPLPEGFIDLMKKVEPFPAENPPTTANIKTFDTFAYVFTSGTTGLPKAVPIPHQRIVCGGLLFGKLIANLEPEDTLYCPLPLFHSNPLISGWAPPLNIGCTFALARRFSIINFWNDIRKYEATCFNYVGEVCRYLVNAPQTPEDKDNQVRVVLGNGLRPEIWNEFKDRFAIETIGEYYAATELGGGFFNFFNFDKTSGYCNKPYVLVKYDTENDELIRDEEGFLVKVDKDEPGLLLFNAKADKLAFLGYLNKKDTESKLIRNAFKKGDAYVNTGDIVLDQGCNHVLFVDRIGDTFRWKGHNISTTEVEGILNACDEVLFSCVYGVKIPGTDGRAGMATLVLKTELEEFDFNHFKEHLNKNLASYAIPLFLRFRKDLEITSTFKLKKSSLKKDSFDLYIHEDPLFVLLPERDNYEALTPDIYKDIQKLKISF